MRAIVIIVGGLVVVAAVLVLILAPWRPPSGPEDRTGPDGPGETPSEEGVFEDGPVGPAEDEDEGPHTRETPDELRRRVPKGVIAGRVVDEAGEPVAEAEIAVLMSRHVEAGAQDGAGENETARPLRREDLFEATLETDTKGEFEVSGVPSVETAPMKKVSDTPEPITCILVAQKAGYRTTWLDVRPGQYELLVVLEETVAVVSGRVVAAESGEPLEGARVECRSATAETEADGTFQVKVPVEVGPPRSIKVGVLCYPREVFYAGKELRDVELVQGEEIDGLLFELDRGVGTVRGTIVEGRTREPAAGMQVRLYERDQRRPYYFPEGSRSELVADAPDGAFVFEHLRAGTYQLEAVKTEWNCPLGRHQVVVPETAEPVEVSMYVNSTSAQVITGTIRDAAGAPVEGAAVWLISSNRLMYQPASSDAEGRYGLQSYSRPSQMKLSVMVFHEDYELGIVPVGSEDERVVQLDVALREAAELAGVVTNEAGEPVEGATIRVGGDALGPEVRVYYAYLPNPRAPATTKADGRYAFTHLPPGEYVISAAHEKYVIAEETIEIAPGADERCDFVLDAGAEIRGTVYDEHGKPLRVRSVVAVGPRGREHDSTVSGADGRFTLRTLPRDTPVNVLVLADVVDLRSDEPFYYAKVEGIEPGEADLRVDATVVRRGSVELEVVEADSGEPVTRYEVYCSGQPVGGLNGLARRFVTSPAYARVSVNDENGRTTLKRLLPGEHRFTVRAGGFRSASTEAVEVTGGDTVRVRVELMRYEGR